MRHRSSHIAVIRQWINLVAASGTVRIRKEGDRRKALNDLEDGPKGERVT